MDEAAAAGPGSTVLSGAPRPVPAAPFGTIRHQNSGDMQ